MLFRSLLVHKSVAEEFIPLVAAALSGKGVSIHGDEATASLIFIGMLRLSQTIQSFCLFVMPPFFLALINRENPLTFLSLRKPGQRPLIYGILSIVAAIPLINVLVRWNEGLHLPASLNGVETWMRQSEVAATALTEKMLSGTTWLDLTLGQIGRAHV